MNRSQSKIKHIKDSNLKLEKRLLKEEEDTPTNIKVSRTNDGKLLLNNIKYRLEIYKLFGWKEVNVTHIVPKNNSFEITGKFGPFTQTEVVPLDSVNKIKIALNQKPPPSEIELGGETKKRLIKI